MLHARRRPGGGPVRRASIRRPRRRPGAGVGGSRGGGDGPELLSALASAAAPAPDPSALLAETLTADAAARIALARNPAFKVKLEEVGLAQADLSQAGILENPRVHGQMRFAGGSGAAGHEFGVKVNLLDFVERPLRKRVASQRLEQAKSRLGHEVLGLEAEARSAFYAHVAARRRLALREQAVESLDAAVELAERQRAAGNISALDLANERASRQTAAAELAHERSRAAAARERLAMLLAIQDRADWTVPDELPAPPAVDPSSAAVEQAALSQRWDLAAARRDPQVLKDALAVERLRFFGPLEVGVDTEREYSGESKFGPEFEIGIPIFERRQASRARLAAQRRQSLASVESLETAIRYEARVTSAELAAAREAVAAYAKALADRKEGIAETLKNYNYMLKGVYGLLEAKRLELDASSAYVDALKDYWSQRAELERVAGGKLPDGGQ
ncbi:MAG: TolC family protein [Elusimicrobiota bacterium]|nr:MAG: TolC family protein [Elusimicrobiota bacterium]